MSRLPIIDARRMEQLLLQIGFAVVRRRGSHVLYRHPDGRTTTLPHHRGCDLARPLIRAILRDVELAPEEYVRLLEER